MKNGPKIVALTGSIAMGKSTAAAMFRDAGIAVFDADEAVHILQGPKGDFPKGAAVDAIERAFKGVSDEKGVDRQKLSQYVMADKEAIATLESIIHPMVAQMRAEFVEAHQNDDILIFDIPLLFEKADKNKSGKNKSGEINVDKVVVVSAPADIQRARALSRPNMSAEKFEHILSLQMPDAQKRAKADYIIDSANGMDNMRHQIKNIIENLRDGLAQ